jgi:hypothetical protein
VDVIRLRALVPILGVLFKLESLSAIDSLVLPSARASLAPLILLSVHLVAEALVGGCDAEHVDEELVQSDYG